MIKRSQTVLIRNGRVVDPSQGFDDIADVVVIDGIVAGIESPGTATLPDGVTIYDAEHKIVSPGFVDLHTHIRTPGQEWKEDPTTASAAAARGGFATICVMPNTYPAQDNASVVGELMQRCEAESPVRVRPIGAITKARAGRELASMHELADAGVVGFSDDGDPVMSPHLMRQALTYSSDLDLPIINHAEDRGLIADWDMNEGPVAMRLGLRGITNSAESIMVLRDIELARAADSRLHVPHVSTFESVEMIRRAKAEGLKVTSEATPHHLAITEDWVYGDHGGVPAVLNHSCYDTNTKMAPPLRAEKDRIALVEGLKDGTIDAIGTDHAPHADTDKVCTFSEAANGILGLETALSLVVGSGDIDLPLAIERLTAGPSAILGDCKIGSLKPGSHGDVAIIDPDAEWTVDRSTLGSKSHNTPLYGAKVKCRVVATFVGGEKVWDVDENGGFDE